MGDFGIGDGGMAGAMAGMGGMGMEYDSFGGAGVGSQQQYGSQPAYSQSQYGAGGYAQPAQSAYAQDPFASSFPVTLMLTLTLTLALRLTRRWGRAANVVELCGAAELVAVFTRVAAVLAVYIVPAAGVQQDCRVSRFGIGFRVSDFGFRVQGFCKGSDCRCRGVNDIGAWVGVQSLSQQSGGYSQQQYTSTTSYPQQSSAASFYPQSSSAFPSSFSSSVQQSGAQQSSSRLPTGSVSSSLGGGGGQISLRTSPTLSPASSGAVR
jgi:hypothetical protein